MRLINYFDTVGDRLNINRLIKKLVLAVITQTCLLYTSRCV